MNLRAMLKKFLRVTCRAWLVTGLCSIAVALGFGVHTAVFLYHSVATKGIIVNSSPARDDEGRAISFTPTFTFIAGDEKTYTVASGVSSNPPDYEVGQEVRILYVKSNPADAELSAFWRLWFVSLVCGGLGVFFSVAGYILLRFERRLNRLNIPVAS